MAEPLLRQGDPHPVARTGADGSRFLLIGDHAGVAVPAALDGLRLPEAERLRHIGWDIGIAGLGERLARRLGAVFLAQAYSRLVIDCNRPPDSQLAMPEVSDGTVVPGNAGLSEAERAARIGAIHAPYQAAIGEALDGMGDDAILIALHSFTPVFGGQARPWTCGVLHLADSPFAFAVLARLRAEAGLIVGDNEPYRMEGTDYTVPFHVRARGIQYAEIEVRQDLIADAAGQDEWAERLDRVLRAALADVAGH